MNTDKTPGKTQTPAPVSQSDSLRNQGLSDRLTSIIPRQIRDSWFWILAYSFNFVYFIVALIHANHGTDTPFTIPILPGIIFTCIIFVQIFADQVEHIPVDGLNPDDRERLERKRSHQRYKWMLFAYSFMLLSLMLTFYPFINPFHDKKTETLRDQPIAVFIGCSLDSPDKHLSCFKPRLNAEGEKYIPEKVIGTWVINIGGYINQCDEENGNAAACQVSDGLLIPLYFIILALMGGSISLTRRLPELQKQVSTEHIGTEQQPRLTQYEFREHLIFQIVQFISAPFLAILAYYLIEPSNLTNSVALAFTAGFASETILLMVRSIANKVTPGSGEVMQYGAVAGVITFKDGTARKTEVFLSESPQIHSITDEQGFYVLGNVPVGEHSISIKLIDNEGILKKDTVRIERAQAIVKKNVMIAAEDSKQK